MTRPPAPHPLDFDWRYDRATAERLACRLQGAGPVLILGAPSVASLLDEKGVEVTLVDRQPLQTAKRLVTSPVEDLEYSNVFRSALIDPPWYPRQLRDWSRIAGRAVGIGGEILISVWPASTRPSATAELAPILSEFNDWAHVERDVDSLTYAPPPFEIGARRKCEHDSLSRSPLLGELIALSVRQLPPAVVKPEGLRTWHRFTVDDYQLAVRIDCPTTDRGVEPVVTADGWHWPYVSARAPGIEDIGIWSSAGEVGKVGDPTGLVQTLRKAFRASNDVDFELELAEVQELLSWSIPRPPYRRSIEWQHRQ